MNQVAENDDLIVLTARKVAEHIALNPVEGPAVPALIKEVHSRLMSSHQQTRPEANRIPVVSPQKSVFPDHIICLHDGKKLKMLRGYIAKHYNMTPEQYREFWGLDPSYPMVAPNYARQRAMLARKSGRKRAKVA